MSWLENSTPTGPQEAIWFLRSTLLLNVEPCEVGRTIRTSGNGTVYAQSGDVWTSEAVASVAGAWFVIRGRPFFDGPEIPNQAIRREWVFQTDGAGNLRVLYSPRLGFVGGTPGPARVPTATDQEPWLGGGTDAAPTYEALLPGPGQRMQGHASEEDDRFWFLTYPVGGGPASSFLFADLPREILRSEGGYLLDKDPLLLYARAGANCALVADLASESRGPRTVFAYGDASMPVKTLWGRAPAIVDYVLDSTGTPRQVYPGGGSTSILYGTPSYPEERVRYVRRAAIAGVLQAGEVGNANTTDDKGESDTIAWSGAPAYAIPTLLDRLDPETSQVRTGSALALGNVILRWRGTPLQL